MPNETDNEEDGARGNVSRRNFFERIGVAGAVAAMPTGPVPAAAQTPAMATEVSADDRFRIQDVLRSYVWANDSTCGTPCSSFAVFLARLPVRISQRERTFPRLLGESARNVTIYVATSRT
jgi:hypothetical protein